MCNVGEGSIFVVSPPFPLAQVVTTRPRVNERREKPNDQIFTFFLIFLFFGL